MSSSDLSELSSSLSSDEDVDVPVTKGTLDYYLKGKNGPGATPSVPSVKKKRPPSPPHEYVLADNPDIAFICMFRSRFSDAFPKSLPHYGPQDIENGIVGPIPGEQLERLLCALLGLLLNRKKDIEKGHYTRALEEAIQTHAAQWPLAWQGKNPLHGGGSFNKMTPEERLTLLRALVLWSLGSSEAVQAIMKESYKRQRQDDDLNQPLSVQSWGRDGDKRRFWLIEGQDDTHFRLYRESNPAMKHVTWRSIAGTIDEVRDVALKLAEENSLLARRLSDRILAAIPRFEASEDKRKRRDYRLARKAQFTRPDPGFSLYEGRTRGKRIRYTYSDEEDPASDALSTRRSNRQSGISTPAEQNRPTFTASGRQVKSRHGGAYGEYIPSISNGASEPPSNGGLDGAADEEVGLVSNARSQRATRESGVKANVRPGKHQGGSDSVESMDDESDVTSSGGEWQGGDDHESDEPMENEDEDEDDDDDVERSDNDGGLEEDPRQSLVVSLRYLKNHSSPFIRDAPGDVILSNDLSIPSNVPLTSEIQHHASNASFAVAVSQPPMAPTPADPRASSQIASQSATTTELQGQIPMSNIEQHSPPVEH